MTWGDTYYGDLVAIRKLLFRTGGIWLRSWPAQEPRTIHSHMVTNILSEITSWIQLIYIQYVGMWTCSRPVVDLYNTWVCPCTGDSKPPRQENRIFQKRSKALMKYTLNHCGSTLGEVDIPFTVSSGKQKWPQKGDSPDLLAAWCIPSKVSNYPCKASGASFWPAGCQWLRRWFAGRTPQGLETRHPMAKTDGFRPSGYD